MTRGYTGEVIENRQITKDTYIIKVRLNKEIEFVAGQFINIEVPVGGRKIKPYSIASPPVQKDVLEFCIKKIPGGVVSTFLYNITLGSKLKITGPYGVFVLKDNINGYIFVATGTGIAGIKPMIEHLLANGYTKPIYLVFGVRKEEDIYYRELFEELVKKHKNFFFIPTLSRAGESWEGNRGYVQQWIKHNIKYSGQHVYICGLVKMVDDVKKVCEELGFPQDHIYTERYV